MTTPTHSHKAWTDKGGHVTLTVARLNGPPHVLIGLISTLGLLLPCQINNTIAGDG